MNLDSSNPNVAKLLALVGKRLGADPNVLRQQLENGKFDAVFQKMDPSNAAKLQQLVNNPALARQLINTPQAKQVLQDILNQANQQK